MIEQFRTELFELARAIRGLDSQHTTEMILHRIEQMERKVMSAITDWAAKEQADLDAISGTLDGVVTGIKALDDKITALQSSPGTLSAEDQAALDAIQQASKALVAKSQAISVTPPAPPAP